MGKRVAYNKLTQEQVLEQFKEYSYKPIKYFSGFSECYRLDLPTQEIIRNE